MAPPPSRSRCCKVNFLSMAEMSENLEKKNSQQKRWLLKAAPYSLSPVVYALFPAEGVELFLGADEFYGAIV